VATRSLSILQTLLAKYMKVKVNKNTEFNEHVDGII
jgi:hypothetical protein